MYAKIIQHDASMAKDYATQTQRTAT